MDLISEARDKIESYLFPPEEPRKDRPLYRKAPLSFAQVAYLALLKYQRDRVDFKAYALTYLTALAIVPMMALSFSIAKGFGMASMLRQALFDRLTGVQPEVLDKIYEYVSNTNVKTLGTLGLVFIVYSVIKTVGSMETAFNQIWNVTKQRSFVRKFSDYLSVMVIFPFLLLAATGVTASLTSATMVDALLSVRYVGPALKFVLSLGSYFTLWVAFTMVYSFLPNTQVPIKSAIAGGVVSGTLWNIVQMIYIAFQIGVSKYNAIYGTFASLPLFLIWLNLSWMIVLFGAQVAWVAGRDTNPDKLRGTRNLTPESTEDLAVAVMLLVGRRFLGASRPYGKDGLAKNLDTDISLVERVVGNLKAHAILSELSGEKPAYQPARSLDLITLQDIVGAAHSLEKIRETQWRNTLKHREREALRQARDLSASKLSEITLLDLITSDDDQTENRRIGREQSG